VSSVSGAQVETFHLTSVEDIGQAAPQLIIARGSSGSGADITMRGIGSPIENIGIEQSVSVNLDGVYLGQGRALFDGLFDVADVQVLKGPQALFYGKNATAGALAIQTKDPGPDFEGSLTAGYEFRAKNPYVEGILSGPVAKNLGVRLAFRVSDMEDGYIKNVATPGIYNAFDTATLTSHADPTAQASSYLGGAKDELVRLTTKWTPTNRLTVTLKGSYDRHYTNNAVDNEVTLYCPLGYPQSEGPQSFNTPCGHSFVSSQPGLPLVISTTPGAIESANGGRDFNHYNEWNGFLKVAYRGDWISLTSTEGYQWLSNNWADNQNFTNADTVFAGERFAWEQVSSENRFNTQLKGMLNFAGGFYFQTTRLSFNQDVDFLGAQNSAASTLDQYVAYNKLAKTVGHTYAVFGQAILDVTPTVEITGGARYTHEIKASSFLQPYVWSPLSGLFVQYDPSDPATTSAQAHQVFGNWSPEATLTWKPNKDLTLYAAYKTGYKSGGFSDSAILSTQTLQSDFRFLPETAKGFELGFKSLLMDRQVRFNLNFFDYLYSNLQVDFFNTPTFNYVTLNAASARTYGLEYQVEYAPRAMPGLLLRAEGAWNESHYGHFIAPCSPAGLTYEEGCQLYRAVAPDGSYTFTPNCGNSAVSACNFMDVSGRETALAPKFTGVFAFNYTHAVTAKLKATVDGDVRISSGYIANPFPSGVAEQIDHQGSYGVLDLAASLGSSDDRWRVSVIAKNLTNTFIVTGAFGLPLSGGAVGCKVAVCGAQTVSDQGASVENPRTVAIQVRVRY
jgi:iron complex outermembrane recepter protein